MCCNTWVLSHGHGAGPDHQQAVDVGLLARLILVIVKVSGLASYHLVCLVFAARAGACAELVGELAR